MAFKRALSLSLGWSGLSAFVAVACATIPDFVVAPAAGDASAFADAARVLDGGARDADASAPRPDPPDCGPKLRIFATQDEYPANFGLINLDAYNTGAIICANVAARMNLGGKWAPFLWHADTGLGGEPRGKLLLADGGEPSCGWYQVTATDGGPPGRPVLSITNDLDGIFYGAPILSEFGEPLPGAARAWTGGKVSSENNGTCEYWSSVSSTAEGAVGDPNGLGSDKMRTPQQRSCATRQHIYCVETP